MLSKLSNDRNSACLNLRELQHGHSRRIHSRRGTQLGHVRFEKFISTAPRPRNSGPDAVRTFSISNCIDRVPKQTSRSQHDDGCSRAGVSLFGRNYGARSRMFMREIVCRLRWNGSCACRVGGGDHGSTGPAQSSKRPQSQGASGRKILWNIDLFNQAHGSSNASVACLNGARLEQSMEG